ncbi:MAG: hypothetical protein QGG40_05770, partial [Myxococcota bacterium]|nr:hypothetical protein [Myxococcota bacterium]
MNPKLRDALERIAAAEILLADAKQALQEMADGDLGAESANPTGSSSVTSTAHTPRDLLSALLRLAADPPDEDALGGELKKLMHSDRHTALGQLIRFNWSTISGRWRDYLDDPSDPDSFLVDRETEQEIMGTIERKLFVEARGRM